MSRFIRLIFTGVALVALVAACAASPTGSGVATLDDPSATASAASPSPSPLSPQDAALAYAKCMREHGVDMPDPVVETGPAGEVKIDQSGGSPVSKDAMEKADTACRSILEASRPNGPAQQLSAEEQDKILAFAKCMRDHGVDMPDPDFTGGGVRMQIGTGTKNGSTGAAKGGPDDPAFQAAQEACGSLLPGKLGAPGGTTTGGGVVQSSAVPQ